MEKARGRGGGFESTYTYSVLGQLLSVQMTRPQGAVR
jgi:hypothetical protein